MRGVKKLLLERSCGVNWDDLASGAKSRFCDSCDKSVHDLDTLSPTEIEDVARANPKGFCGAFLSTGKREFRIAGQDDNVPRGHRAGLSSVTVLAAVVGACGGGEPRVPELIVPPVQSPSEPQLAESSIPDCDTETGEESELCESVELLKLLGAMGYVDDE